MYPPYEHNFYAWLIIISVVCCAIIIGALLDMFIIKRHFGNRLQTRRMPVTNQRHSPRQMHPIQKN